MPDDIGEKIAKLEEQQMFLERLVDQLSGEVLELSRTLRIAQNELKRLQALIDARRDQDASAGDSDQQSGA